MNFILLSSILYIIYINIIFIMEVFLDRVKKNLNLEEEIYQSVRNIIISESNFIKFENFKNTLKIVEKMNNEYNLFVIYLLFIYDINKDFKNDLLLHLKDKKNYSVLTNISEKFFEILEYDNECDNLEYIRMKLKIFNNFHDILKSAGCE